MLKAIFAIQTLPSVANELVVLLNHSRTLQQIPSEHGYPGKLIFGVPA